MPSGPPCTTETTSVHRRAGLYAVGLVLEHCLVLGRPWWAWSIEEWAGLLAGSAEAFLAERSLPTETTVRPFVVAFAYLVSGFDRFEQLGTFNRLHLAKLVFGADAVETTITEVAATLDAWGYRIPEVARHQLRGVVSQALLVNRSPLIEDLSTETFARLRGHPATGHYQPRHPLRPPARCRRPRPLRRTSAHWLQRRPGHRGG